MKLIKTPTRRMRIWSFNLNIALIALKNGDTQYAINMLEKIISEMRGN